MEPRQPDLAFAHRMRFQHDDCRRSTGTALKSGPAPAGVHSGKHAYLGTETVTGRDKQDDIALSQLHSGYIHRISLYLPTSQTSGGFGVLA